MRPPASRPAEEKATMATRVSSPTTDTRPDLVQRLDDRKTRRFGDPQEWFVELGDHVLVVPVLSHVVLEQ